TARRAVPITGTAQAARFSSRGVSNDLADGDQLSGEHAECGASGEYPWRGPATLDTYRCVAPWDRHFRPAPVTRLAGACLRWRAAGDSGVLHGASPAAP